MVQGQAIAGPTAAQDKILAKAKKSYVTTTESATDETMTNNQDPVKIMSARNEPLAIQKEQS